MKKSFLAILSLVMVMGSLGANANGINREARHGRDDRRQPPPSAHQMCPTGRMGYAIEFRDQQFEGRNNIIALKRELARAYPRLDLRRSDLLSVCLMAKSQHGRGTAELIVGPSSQDRRNIGGSSQGYDNPRDRTFDEVELRNFRRNDNGVWQVHLNGRVKVRRVVVHLAEERRRPPVRMNYLDFDAGKFDKIIFNTKTIRVNRIAAEEISLVGKDKFLDIKSVVVNFTNGTRRHLSELEGRLREGQIKTTYVDGRVVESISVEATSADLFGGRAELLLRVGYR